MHPTGHLPHAAATRLDGAGAPPHGPRRVDARPGLPLIDERANACPQPPRVRTFASRGGVAYSLTELFFAVSPMRERSPSATWAPIRETADIFTLDIATGKRRRQLTHLPATPAVLSCLTFLDRFPTEPPSDASESAAETGFG